MNQANSPYRVESEQPICGSFWPVPGERSLAVHRYDLAVSLAAKSQTRPRGSQIRVVHVPTGEIVFTKT